LSSLREVFAIQDRNVHEEKDGLGSKFTVYKLACGNMADFHKGLYARIGSPNLDFEATMKAEHCSKAGCNVPFTTSNYGISTTPQLEWQYIVGNEQLEEVDALDHTGCWYQAFVIKRTDAGALVHFEGTDMSCDETIPLADIPSRIRVRSEKGTIEETCNVVAARHIKLHPVDVKSDGRNNCKWFPGFIISTNEAGVCVHTKNNPGEVIPHSALAERIRARSSVGPLPLDMNDLVSRFSSDFSKFVEECDVVDEDGIWRAAFAIRRPNTPSEILVHFARKTQDWDEIFSLSEFQARMRCRSAIGPLGEVVAFFAALFVFFSIHNCRFNLFLSRKMMSES
jgi:hypothetical protein